MERVQLWMDGVARSGPENMAVDEWLLEAAEEPVVRVYRWLAGWGSCGYFVKHEEAERALAGLQWVRRWTGGGIVDHRYDWTYTVVIPRGEALAESRGAESYRVIHGALAKVMSAAGAALAGKAAPAAGGVCFLKAVEHDVVDAAGRKLAGAGQRRTAEGLLHQGSVAGTGDAELGRKLAAELARAVVEVEFRPPEGRIRAKVLERYDSVAWRQRR
jgi:lipoate-protein ligase A